MRVNNLYISNSDKRNVTPRLVAQKLWPLLAFIFIFLVGIDFVFTQKLIFLNDFSNQGKVKRLIDGSNPNEIPVFGSSLARSSFIPDSISPDCYNFGMGKALYDVTRILLKIECGHDKESPIIFELNPRTFIRDPKSSINTSTFIPLLYDARIEHFMRESDTFNWQYKVPGLRYFGNYFEYGISPLRRTSGTKRDNRGVMLETKTQDSTEISVFARRLENMTSERNRLLEKLHDPNKYFDPVDDYILKQVNSMIYFSYDTAYIEEFESLIRNNPKRKFILVTVPANPNFIEPLPNFDSFLKFANNLAEKFPNAYYLDYHQLPTEIDHYKDPMHFGTKGANVFMTTFQKDFERITGIAQNGYKTSE